MRTNLGIKTAMVLAELYFRVPVLFAALALHS